ncbi:MAG: hypothetical protein Q8O34_16050 [Rhodocyclaceae bacterium]|nr:hypothetical protein [Rhodocyclaceae bacterium]
MKNFPAELLYVLMFVAIVLFQYLMKRFGPQQREDAVPQERLPQFPEEVKETPAAPSVSSVASGDFGRAEAPDAAPALPRRRFSRASLMGTRRQAQNAVVIATILGPCRAFEPHDVR